MPRYVAHLDATAPQPTVLELDADTDQDAVLYVTQQCKESWRLFRVEYTSFGRALRPITVKR